MAKKTAKSTAKPMTKKKVRKKVARKAPRAAALPVWAAPEEPAPISLDDVLGQDRALGVLRRAIASGRFHHGWIFHGPRGVGKFTAALAAAAAVLDPTCDEHGRTEPDSEARRLLSARAHPDLHIVRKELAAVSRDAQTRSRKQSSLPLGVIEEFVLEPAARTRQVQGDSIAGKVFVIDEAHLLNPASQNALLKTLEEPPSGTVLMLVTDQEDRLLPTIRSRCQRVAFAPLDARSMRLWLDRAGPDATPEQMQWLLEYAHGSPGVLIEAHRGGLHAWHLELAPMLDHADRGGFSLDLAPTIARLIEERAKRLVEARAGASKEAANKAAANELLRMLADRAHRALRARPEDSSRALATLGLLDDARAQLNANVQIVFVAERLAACLARAPAETGL